MPSASTICLAFKPSAAPTPAAAPITPKIAVGWKPALCTAFGTTVREPAHTLGADRDAEQRRGAVRSVALAGRQHRRHHHRAGMHRAALEGVVEILAMRGGAVDEGGAGRAQRAGMADRGARPVVVAAGERGLDVILVARGDAEAGDVDQPDPRTCARTAAGSLAASSATIARPAARRRKPWEVLPLTNFTRPRRCGAHCGRAGCWRAPPR